MKSGTFNSVNSLIENMTDDQLREIHDTLHNEAFKRGMRLATHTQNRSKDDPEEGTTSFKSIESL